MPVKRNQIKYKIINIKKIRNVRSTNLMLYNYVFYMVKVNGLGCCFPEVVRFFERVLFDA